LETLHSPARSWIDDEDRRFARRCFVAALCILVVAGFLTYTWRFFEKKFFITTGEAEWIWVRDPMSREKPVAFFATRDFEVPPGATEVTINIAADPSYTLWFNGARVGAGSFRSDRAIRSHNVTALKRDGKNRIVVACRSDKGAGGLLLSVDFGGMQRNGVFTDRRWRIFRRWDERLLQRDLPGADDPSIRSFGAPPVGRWNYPERRVVTELSDLEHPLQPATVVAFDGRIPETRILSGIAVASARTVPARAFDFGAVNGQIRVTRTAGDIEVIRIRYANAQDELAKEGTIVPLVFAPGESSVTDASRTAFRYVIVYGASGEVVVEPFRK
jgi:hypothetical protein